MSDNVVIFAPRGAEPEQPHIGGEARCVACQHEWAAVAPVGTFGLECPACGCFRGAFKFPVDAPSGSEVWTCACSGDTFFVTREGIRCQGCGSYQTFPALRR